METSGKVAAAQAVDQTRCYHCGLAVPPGGQWTAQIDGVPRPMCCPGCQAVATAIVAGGLHDFYRFRTEPGRRPDGDDADITAYALDDVARHYVTRHGENQAEATLVISGITCAACAWLIEKSMQRINGVQSVQVNFATHRALVQFDPGRVTLADLLHAVSSVGYTATPFAAVQLAASLESERRQQLKRLGVAGLMGMQIMMLATALYFGAHQGIDPLYRALLRWASLLLAVPIVLYSARPFFQKAWRNLRRMHFGMDLPVSLGILFAFAGSVVATWSGSGHVYYESVAMFVFFLLGARYLEFAGRNKANQTLDTLARAAPVTALRLADDGSFTATAAATLSNGDHVLVRAGDTFPADGLIIEGTTSADESLLTGESRPVDKAEGDTVVGGSVNIDGSVIVQVSRAGSEGTLAQILQLAERAHAHRPRAAVLADRAAQWFVMTVLLIAGATALYWWLHASPRWLEITIAVLVVTCPCALSLATPTALATAIGALTRSGLVPANGDATEKLRYVTHVVFDKTGTLTTGQFEVHRIHAHAELNAADSLAIAAALEQHSNHPIARSLIKAAHDIDVPRAVDVSSETGSGISGRVNGERYWIGRHDWIEKQVGSLPEPDDGIHSMIYLADSDRCLATISLSDPLREDAAALVTDLKTRGLKLSICSGDRQAAVARIARQLNIDDFHFQQGPDAKLTYVRTLQRNGERVLVIGDGINDAPVLASADVSIAMTQAAPLAQQRADLIVINDQLSSIGAGLTIAGKTVRIIKQNLLWAAGYNLCALPAAVMGWVPPWAAALGMSASSLMVVGNALRLREKKADDRGKSNGGKQWPVATPLPERAG